MDNREQVNALLRSLAAPGIPVHWRDNPGLPGSREFRRPVIRVVPRAHVDRRPYDPATDTAVDALIDTGATHVSANLALADALRAPASEDVHVNYAFEGVTRMSGRFLAFLIPETGQMYSADMACFDGQRIPALDGFGFVLGMQFIQNFRLVLDGPAQSAILMPAPPIDP